MGIFGSDKPLTLPKNAVFYVNFPNHKVSLADGSASTSALAKTGYKPELGHAGVMTIDSKGNTRYYDYGRYKSGNIIGVRKNAHDGNYRRVPIPNYKGLSADEFKKTLQSYFDGDEVELVGAEDADILAVHDYMENEARNPNRDEYNLMSKTCGSLAYNAVRAGKPANLLESGLSFFDGPEFTPSQYARSLRLGAFKKY